MGIKYVEILIQTSLRSTQSTCPSNIVLNHSSLSVSFEKIFTTCSFLPGATDP